MNSVELHSPQHRRQTGLTIVEIMVALAVASILIGLALPAFNNFIAQRSLTAQVNDFMVALQYARSEAGRRGTTVSVQANDPSSPTDEWGPGWCVVVGGAGACDGTELRLFPTTGANTLDGTGAMDGVATLTFNSRGLLTNGVGGAFDLCRAGETVGRRVVISTIGRVSSQPKTDCP